MFGGIKGMVYLCKDKIQHFSFPPNRKVNFLKGGSPTAFRLFFPSMRRKRNEAVLSGGLCFSLKGGAPPPFFF